MAVGLGASVRAALLLLALLLAASRPAVPGRAARGAPQWRQAPLGCGPGGRKAPAPDGERGGPAQTDRQSRRWAEAPLAQPGLPLPCSREARLGAETASRKGAACPEGAPLPRRGSGRRGPGAGLAAPAGEARQQPPPRGVGREPLSGGGAAGALVLGAPGRRWNGTAPGSCGCSRR